LCVFEEQDSYHYEASNLPDRILKFYCSGECLDAELKEKMDLFKAYILQKKLSNQNIYGRRNGV